MTPPEFAEVPLCGTRPDCRIKNGRWPECAKDTQVLHPSFSAEEICPHALARHINTHRIQNSEFSGLCTAMDAVEYGLSLPDYPDEAVRFFNYAEQIFTGAQERVKDPRHIAMARLGATFIPVYEARYFNQPLSHRETAAIHANVIDILATIDDDFPQRIPVQHWNGLKAELVVTALFSRIGQFDWLAYPATPREEHSTEAEFNHDCYVMFQGIKVPIQAKRKNGHRYDPTVAVVRFSTILQRVNDYHNKWAIQQWGDRFRRRVGPQKPLDYDDFIDLLVREVRGPQLNHHESKLLMFGSMAAAAEVMEKYQTLRSQYELAA